MVGVMPKVKDFQLYNQREVAELLEVSYVTIINHEKEGRIIGRPCGKYKFYTGKEIKRYWKEYFSSIW